MQISPNLGYLDLPGVGPKDIHLSDNTRKVGAPGMIRTCDLLVRSQTLYPTELRARAPYYSKGPVYFSRAGAAASAVFLSARILILRLILRFRWRP
jgi:hypothetical protein